MFKVFRVHTYKYKCYTRYFVSVMPSTCCVHVAVLYVTMHNRMKVARRILDISIILLTSLFSVGFSSVSSLHHTDDFAKSLRGQPPLPLNEPHRWGSFSPRLKFNICCLLLRKQRKLNIASHLSWLRPSYLGSVGPSLHSEQHVFPFYSGV